VGDREQYEVKHLQRETQTIKVVTTKAVGRKKATLMEGIWASYRSLCEQRFMYMFNQLSKNDIWAAGGRLAVITNKPLPDVEGYGVEGISMSELLLPGMSNVSATPTTKFGDRQSNTLLNLT
jgi:hypothetical protein